MAIGGFNNQGGNITLAQFKSYVKAGDVRYFIASGGGLSGGGAGQGTAGGPGGGFPGAGASRLRAAPPSGARGGFAGGGPSGQSRSGGPGGSAGSGSSSSAITTWVKAHYKSVTIGSTTVYDLTQPRS